MHVEVKRVKTTDLPDVVTRIRHFPISDMKASCALHCQCHCFLEVFLRHVAVIMHDNVLIAQIQWKTRVQVASKLHQSKVLVIAKDEDVGLLQAPAQWQASRALIVVGIFNTVYNFMSCVYSVGKVRGDLDKQWSKSSRSQSQRVLAKSVGKYGAKFHSGYVTESPSNIRTDRNRQQACCLVRVHLGKSVEKVRWQP